MKVCEGVGDTSNMAEAAVDGAPMSRFFCHRCSVEIEHLLPVSKPDGILTELNVGRNTEV